MWGALAESIYMATYLHVLFLGMWVLAASLWYLASFPVHGGVWPGYEAIVPKDHLPYCYDVMGVPAPAGRRAPGSTLQANKYVLMFHTSKHISLVVFISI